MILFWFLAKQASCALRIIRAQLRLRVCRQEQTSLLRQLGRRAWELRKQHVGMDDILDELVALEDEDKELAKQAHELRQQAEDRPHAARELQRTHERTLERRAKIRRENAEKHLLLGKAVDASRHHDAALIEYYQSIDDCTERRQELRQHRRVLAMSFLRLAPFALMELAALIFIGLYVFHRAKPIFTEYHVVFRDDFAKSSGRWRQVDGDRGGLTIRDRAMVLQAPANTELCVAPKLKRPFRDVWVKMRVAKPARADIVGIILRRRLCDFYVVEVRGDGRCRLSVYLAGRRSVVRDWRLPGKSPSASDSFTLEARAVRDKIAVTLDGSLVFLQDELEEWRGDVGVYVPAGGSASVTHFEVRVKGLSGWWEREKRQ